MKTIAELVRSVLEEGRVMSLATEDSQGLWVADIMYLNDTDLNIYWISNTKTRHSTAIKKNRKVAATITLSRPDEKFRGIQVEGEAKRIEGDVLQIPTTHLFKRGPVPHKKYNPKTSGNSWYKLTPKSIDLIYEPVFGLIKKKLKFPITKSKN